MGLRRQDWRLGSSIRRLGAAAGLNAGVWTPASLGAALLSWREYAPATTFAAGATPITDGTNIYGNVDARDSGDSQSYPVAMSEGGVILWNAANKAAVYDGGSFLELWNDLGYDGSVSLPLTAGFALYAVGYRASATKWVPGGFSQSSDAFYIDNAGLATVVDDENTAHTAAVTANAGLIVARWRGNVSGNVYFACSGQAEVLLANNPGTLTIDQEGLGNNLYTDSGNDHRAWLVVNADTVATGTDVNIRAYLKTTFRVSL
jgi:hypothetical protein